MTEKYFSFSVNPEGIAELAFNNKELKVNVLDTGLMLELNGLLSGPAADKSIKAMVIKSLKPGIFMAGADLHEIYGISSIQLAKEKSGRGQEIMNKIEKLPYPTVCVINGACLGGGLELCLAATFRIVSDGVKTKIGLPETTLGIVPGFGGTYRLPKLVGLKKGIEMILTGKSVNGMTAYKMNLADGCFPEEFLEEKTGDFVKRILDPGQRKILTGKRKRKKLSDILSEGNPAGRLMIYLASRGNALRKTRGFYPAVLSALRAIRKNYGKPAAKALETERRYFSETATSPVAKKLIGMFFVNEELKKAYQPPDAVRDSIDTAPVRFAGVMGAGKMGGAIAWLLSDNDIDVRMRDISLKSLSGGYRAAHEIYSQLQSLKKIDARLAGLRMHRITGTVGYDGFSKSDFIIEAVAEDMEIKKSVYAELEKVIGHDAVIATNTSSYSVDSLSAGLERPERFAGMHFFNPVNRMQLVEVVRGKNTSELTLHKAVSLARRLGKIPVVVNDCNGFLVNRILMSYLDEASLMIEEGADFTKIDDALYDFGMPMGPFTLLDEIGIKVGYKVAKILHESYPSRSGEAGVFSKIGNSPELNGRATGKGFYIYSRGKKRPNREIYEILVQGGIKFNKKMKGGEMVDRCLLRMINESSFCIQEKIIDDPGFLDLALIYGTGFPPFRGGILHYADDIGIDNVVNGMESLESKYGSRFTPSGLLTEMKRKNRRFYS